MGNSFIYKCKVSFLLYIFFSACFNDPSDTFGGIDPLNQPESLPVSIDFDQTNYDLLQTQIDYMNNQLLTQSIKIKSLSDSLKAFQQLNISVETSDRDLINSLIRIQTKLNLIEEKMFYSDSLYFNLLNDLVIIESQIEDLDQNMNNISNLSFSEEDDVSLSKINIEDYNGSYDLAIEKFMNKDYDESLAIFESLISFDANNVLSDNAQFWMGQIFYIQKDYRTAIDTYRMVSSIGDSNKAPDARYKIALSYFNLGMFDSAMSEFEAIISSYPEKVDLISKSKKYIERYK